ncbi:HU family DNA-binding protein [Yoonia sp.]|uniref:HU family DNA-binding protein n=1 Tax=Yoonia sp. TaxID=2212373 RepID=UPI00391BC2B3
MVNDTEETAAEVVQLIKADLFDQVVARSNLKKRDVKPAVEAALAVIGEALARGEDLVLPPLGKIRVIKTKDLGEGAQALTLKLRTMKDAAKDAGQSDQTALASPDADD